MSKKAFKSFKYAKAIDIEWETDGEEVNLPTDVKLPPEIDEDDDDAICDYLSDEYGWLVISYRVQKLNGEIR